MIKKLTRNLPYVYCLDFSINNQYLATGSSDQSVIIWDCKDIS